MKRLFIVCALALSITACSSMLRPSLLGPSDAERREYDAAIATARKDPTQGRARLASFLDRHPESSLADDAVVPLARLEVKAGNPAEAEKRLRDVLRAHPKENRSDAARLELAKRISARGDYEAASKVAEKIQPSLLGEAERRDAYVFLAGLAHDRGDTAAQLEWLGRLRTVASDEAEVAEVDRQIDAVIAKLQPEGLVRAAERLGRRVPATELWLRAGEISLRAGDTSGASHALAEAERLPLSPDEAQQLVRLQGMLQSGRGGPVDRSSPPPPPLSQVEGAEIANPAARATGNLGVVLPLSGSLAPVAEDVLRGVLLAADTFGPETDGPGLRVLVRDSAGRPEQAASAVRELGQRGDVSAVVGPLTKEEVEAAGAAGQEVGLPLLTLTRHEGVARDRAEVVRFGLTRRMEAEVLADHAVLGLGIGRMAILYPKDEYGREFEALLWQAIEARGARVVSVAGYDPTATDFAAPIRRLLGPQSAASPGAGEPLGDPNAPVTPGPPPLLDFDAIFIPDAHDKVALIALQLAASQVHGVKLLGPSGWHHPDLLRVAGPAVDGAFFSSGFDPSHPSPLIQDFVARYRAAYGSEPTPFAAQGFDAANLVGLQLVNGAQSPTDVRNGLVTTDRHPGVSGVTSIGSDGDARKRPFLLEVSGGQMKSLE
jgi:ABC-type branched-subunit amino acid transport system substrate-binding protein